MGAPYTNEEQRPDARDAGAEEVLVAESAQQHQTDPNISATQKEGPVAESPQQNLNDPKLSTRQNAPTISSVKNAPKIRGTRDPSAESQLDFRRHQPHESRFPRNVLLLENLDSPDHADADSPILEFSWASGVQFSDGIWHRAGVLTDVSRLLPSQDGISDHFVNIKKELSAPKEPRLVRETADDIAGGRAFLVNDRILENPTAEPEMRPSEEFRYADDEIPPMQVFWHDEQWYSVDCRRLEAIRSSGVAQYIDRAEGWVPAALRRNFVWKEGVALGILVEVVDGEHNPERFDKGWQRLRRQKKLPP